jgi:hypothetical protein
MRFQEELEDAKGPPDGWNRSAVRLLSTGIDKATSYDGMDTVDMTMSVVIFQKEKADVETCASEEARQTIQWMGRHGNTYRKVEVIFDIKHRVHACIVTACQMRRADVQMRS